MNQYCFGVRDTIPAGASEIKVTYPDFPTANGISLAVMEGSDFEFVTVLSRVQDPTHPNWKLLLSAPIQKSGGYTAAATIQQVSSQEFEGPWLQTDALGNLHMKREEVSLLYPPVRWHLRFFGFAAA